MRAAIVVMCVVACGHPAPPPVAPRAKLTLAVLPAESDAFPKAAQAATDQLSKVKLGGIDETKVSKVSLEVVQLSIECVEESVQCYQAVGKSLAANRLLFAQIAPDANPKQLKVTVTLFDVDSEQPRTAEKVFADEDAASAGIANLVGEATR